MSDLLFQIDLAIFYFFNHTLSNPLFDKFFPFITDVKHWYLVYVIFLLILLINGKKLGRLSAVGAIFLITVTDQFSSSLLKNLVGRIRPCNELPDVNILAGCTSAFSFPSSHAVNNFAVAVFFSILFPKYKIPLFIVAFLLAISRVYVGVHYPSDIIGGALIGSTFGYIFAIATKFMNEKFLTKSESVHEIKN